jgi:hypothetical protein
MGNVQKHNIYIKSGGFRTHNLLVNVDDVNLEEENITNSMELVSAGEGTSRSAGQVILCISCKTKVHYRVHSSPPLILILSQSNPVHKHKHYFYKMPLSTIYE